jgi:hypothetical protein
MLPEQDHSECQGSVADAVSSRCSFSADTKLIPAPPVLASMICGEVVSIHEIYRATSLPGRRGSWS